MAPPIAVDTYVSVVRRSGLVQADRLDEALKELEKEIGPPSDSTVVAQRLMDRQLVTPWQNEKLMAGKHKGFLLGKYKLLNYIGAGGMSTVYLAEHILMRRRVAIKILPTARVNDSSYLERFHREARAIASLDHVNIVRAYNVDNDNNLHYIVMEFVEGQDLERIVVKEGPLSYARAVDYMRQAADGLEHAHARGMIHRDIKPSNLLLDREGTVKILDMGLARLTDKQERNLTIEHKENVLGTTDYLAPEQAIDSHNIDLRADLYALGCTLYFLLTGHPPFPEGTLAQRLVKHQTEEPKDIKLDRPDAPADLIEICRKLRAKKPAHRYQTAGEVSAVLAQWQEDHGIETNPKRRGSESPTRPMRSSGESTLSLPRSTQQEAARAAAAPPLPAASEAAPLIDIHRGSSSGLGLGGSPSQSRKGSSVNRRGSSIDRSRSGIGQQAGIPPWVWACVAGGVLVVGGILFLVMGSGSTKTAVKGGKGAKTAEPDQVGDYATWSGLPMGSIHELRFNLTSDGNRNLTLKTMAGPKNVQGKILLDDKVIQPSLDLGDLSTGTREFPLGKHMLKAGTHRLSIDLSAKPVARPNWVTYEPWHLIGPFPNEGDQQGFDAVYPPEKEPFDLAKEYDGKGGKVKWAAKNYGDTVVHDLKPEFGANTENIAYYLYRKVKATKAGKATFYMGSDDTLTVFLNGAKVFPGRKTGRGTAAYDDTVPVDLKQGDNALLLKICQGNGGTGFFFTDTPPSSGNTSGAPLKFGLSFPPAR